MKTRPPLDAERIEAVADRGYYKIGDVEDCEVAGVTPYVPKSARRPSGRGST